jgi:hypothetical protein
LAEAIFLESKDCFAKKRSQDRLEKLQRANLRLEKFRRLLAVCVRMKFLNPSKWGLLQKI